MRASNTIISQTNIENGLELTTFLNHAGFIHQESGGVFNYLSLGLIAMEKLENKLDSYMRKMGCVKWKMAALQCQKNWEKTQRDKKYGNELIQVTLNKGVMRLSATAEEQITNIYHSFMKNRKANYWFYQITDKWRDEMRAKGGLVRGKEFRMMDAYSFDSNKIDMIDKYEKGKNILVEFLKDLGLEVKVQMADCGEVGGSVSEEIMVKSHLGGDDGWIEVGHVFCLEDKYSKAFNLKDCDGGYVYMTCHGLGVSRLLAIMLDKIRDDTKIIGSDKFCLFDYVIVGNDKNEKVAKKIEKIKEKLENDGMSVIHEDRFKKMGQAMNASERVGARRRIVVKLIDDEVIFEDEKLIGN